MGALLSDDNISVDEASSADSSDRDGARPTASVRIHTIDAMRGLAALAVAWYHLTYGDPSFLPDGLLKSSGRYGGVGGVQTFFVISGFIIPFALYQAKYTHRSFFRFLGKRMLRLDPPYIASIAFVLFLGAIAREFPQFLWHLHGFKIRELAAHLGYLNGFFAYRWLNNVYWTLAIELQYYLLIALAFPLSQRLPKRTAWLFPFMLVLASWLPRPRLGGAPLRDDLILPYLGVFAIGFLAFQHRIGAISWRTYLPLLVGAGIAVFLRENASIAVAAVAAATVISLVAVRHPLLSWLGECSYSLYLVHEPVRWVAYAAARMDPSISGSGREIVACVALVVSFALARLMYVVVERPSQRLSSRLRYAPSYTASA
jgi:peptidoglycan/LPS O-acetylase OafA/YrhL